MKKLKLLGMAVTSLFMFSLLVSCSSDSDDDKDNDVTPYVNKGKKLQRIVCNEAYEHPYDAINYVSFEYDNDVLSSIHSVWHDYDGSAEEKSVTFFRTDDTIIWYSENGKEVAHLVNGRAVSMTMRNCKFHYDDKGRLTTLEADRGLMKLTWEGDNIKRFDYSTRSETFSMEYTYSKYKARMLQYYHVFNPFGDDDFLDCLDEGALFYTGACGPLSENLPSQVVYKINGVVYYTNSFQYTVDSSGYPIKATLLTDCDDMVGAWGEGLYGPMYLEFTWE